VLWALEAEARASPFANETSKSLMCEKIVRKSTKPPETENAS